MSSHTSHDDSIERPNTTPDFETLEARVPWATSRDQWLYWNAAEDTPRKPLENPNADYGASWTDPSAWLAYEEVKAASTEVDTAGIGFVFANTIESYEGGAYGALDLDGCLKWDDGRPKPKDWLPSLKPFLDRGAYIELSPSGTGLHIPIKGFEEPDWWSDCHFSDEEHEGVEAYSRKFFTFTGEALDDAVPNADMTVADEPPEHGDWLDAWLREAYKAVTGDDPVTTGSRYDDNSDRNRREEFLDKDDIREALDHIDPDVSYELWRDIGFALTDFFPKPTAEKLFKDWSSGGSKWDSNAERQAERIIDDGGSGGRTIGTVIHYAKQNGWEMPEHPVPDNPRVSYSDGLEKREDDGYYRYKGQSDDGELIYDEVANFTLLVISRRTYEKDDRREYTLEVNPRNEPAFEVTVETGVFNNVRDFKANVVTGFSTYFNGSGRDVSAIRDMLAAEDVPVRKVVSHIGIHDDEFVTPEGSFTADGWVDSPNYVLEDDNNLTSNWMLSPHTHHRIDEEEVASILQLLPQTRRSERFIPTLGWFYAAPFRSVIKEKAGQFNNHHVMGDTEAGKSTTLTTLSRMFGLAQTSEASSSKFVLEKTLSATNTVPVTLDEYKPSDWSKKDADRLHDLLRKVTDGQVIEKGRPDLSTRSLHVQAPTAVAGEQPIQGPAESRRAVMTAFTKDATRDDSEYYEAFAKLAGGRVGTETYDGHNFSQHAYAYYRWVLEQDEDDIEQMFETCSRRVDELMTELSVDGVDNAKKGGYTVVLLGVKLYKEFAEEYSVSPETHGVTVNTAEDAITYLADEGDGADGESHLEKYLDITGRAIRAGYLEEDEHYTFVNIGTPDECIALQRAYAFDAVSRYVSQHDIDEGDLFSSYNDYKSRIRDAEDDESSPVVEFGKVARFGDETIRADTFIPAALGFASLEHPEFKETDTPFDDDYSDGSGKDNDSELVGLDHGFADVTATVTSKTSPKPWQYARGIVTDVAGVPMDFVVAEPEDSDIIDFNLIKDETYTFETVRVTEDDNGVTILRIVPGTTEISAETDVEQQPNPDTDEQPAATDGGDEMP